jgi:putative endopeptidase
MLEKAFRLLRSRFAPLVLLGSSCGPASEAAPPPAAPSAAAAPPATVATQHGVDLAGMDTAVAPGADFFAYANGTWAKQTEIPPDRSNWGVASELAEATARQVRALLEEIGKSPGEPGSEARKVADYYSSFMDEAAIEARGTAPLIPVLARIAGLKDKGDLARELGGSLRADVDPLNSTNFHTDRLFGLFVSGGFSAPERNVPYLLQGGLGLPDRDFYVNGDARMQGIRAQYRAHVSAILRLAGIADPDTKAAEVLALETKIAAVHVTREGSSQVLDANNPWHRSEFTARAPGLDWARFFQAAGLDRESVFIVWQPSAIIGTAQLVRSEPLSVWKDWLTFHAIDRKSRLLPRAFVAEDFAFYGHAMRGTPQLEERWKRGIASTNAALADAVGKLYVERHFSAAAKADLQAMVQTIVQAFRARVEALDWMAPATRAKALAKLSTLYVGVGYPDRWLDYSELEVVPGDVVGNAERAELARYRRSLAKLGQPMDKAEWWMMVQLVNAVNVPLQNALNFPAAILAPPFFDPEAPAAVNYGAIGAVIGHEISHSFDDQGAQFDENGKLTDWWTKADREHFEASGASLVTQYDAYEPLPGLRVNGHLTLGENIADLAGLAAAHDGWLASLKGQPAPVVQGLSGEQQFFIAFAQAWRGKQREPTLRQQLIVDGHAPQQYRAATVRNLDAWYEAFGVQPGQALYLEPKDRVRVW